VHPIRSIAACLVLAAAASACEPNGTTDPDPEPVASVTVTAPGTTLVVNATVQLTATLRDAAGDTLTDRIVTWTSLDPVVARVDSTGLVTALAAGSVAIRAGAEGQTGDITLTVTPPPVASVTVSPDTATLKVDSVLQLAVTLRDAGGTVLTGRAVAWSSTDTARAQVSATGLVTARAAGAVAVVATSEGRADTAQLQVVAPPPPPPAPVLAPATIAAGYSHTCALTAAGAAYCWGDNAQGQLGDGTTTDRTLPVAVVGGHTFTTIAAAANTTCAIDAAGAAYCWGENRVGQVGDGSRTGPFNGPDRHTSPRAVAGGHVFAMLDVGGSYGCALTQAGAAYCWGDNTYKQGGFVSSSYFSSVPLPVQGGHAFVQISARNTTTCALNAAGAAFCWGHGGQGEAGTGTYGIFDTPTAVVGGHTFALLDVGATHSCALTPAGAAYCWGTNVKGELGNGTSSQLGTPSPQAVLGGLSFTRLVAGGGYTCAVDGAGMTWCWGTTEEGRLGIPGAIGTRPQPASQGTAFGFRALAANRHACGVDAAGVARCWATNDNGQLGDGTTTNRDAPTLVSGGQVFAAP
jgi:alpha-tubulin suppressor-like RCC1 family protein